jgi:hypothetical protein
MLLAAACGCAGRASASRMGTQRQRITSAPRASRSCRMWIVEDMVEPKAALSPKGAGISQLGTSWVPLTVRDRRRGGSANCAELSGSMATGEGASRRREASRIVSDVGMGRRPVPGPSSGASKRKEGRRVMPPGPWLGTGCCKRVVVAGEGGAWLKDCRRVSGATAEGVKGGTRLAGPEVSGSSRSKPRTEGALGVVGLLLAATAADLGVIGALSRAVRLWEPVWETENELSGAVQTLPMSLCLRDG